jgi:hypothetical protein
MLQAQDAQETEHSLGLGIDTMLGDRQMITHWS